MPEELSCGTRLGRYDLLLRIGRGGMATVWIARERAERREQERIVAVKAMLSDLAYESEFVKMFLDEGRLVQRIRHPNVVDVYEVGQAGDIVYMAMEWVEGDSLHALIAEAGKRRPIPPEIAVRIIADVAAGLHAAHELTNERGENLGVVHRDVSPHNILIGTSGAVKLVDFGVAKAKERLADATMVGQVKGKFGYMSPEQAVARPVDRRSDLFSLGIVLFEVTTGRRLFRGDSDAETLALVVQGEIPRPSTIDPRYPPLLEAIVMRALSRSRRERFQTARDFELALEQYLKQERIVVSRAAIASLLRRVLGESIEQRRRAIRAALKLLDRESGHFLISAGSAFPAGGADLPVPYDSGAGSGSNRSAVPWVPSSDQPTSSSTGGGTGSATGSGIWAEARSGLLGYLIGMAGLLVALAALIFYYVQRNALAVRATTSLPAASSAARSASLPPNQPTSTARELRGPHGGLPTIPIDQLWEDRQ